MHEDLGVGKFMVPADMIEMGMGGEQHERLVQPGRQRRAERGDGHAGVDEKVAIAALDEKRVCADEPMAVRFEDADETGLDDLLCEPGIGDGKAHAGSSSLAGAKAASPASTAAESVSAPKMPASTVTMCSAASCA